MKRVHVVVHGFVQGVGFRYATADRARMGSLSGFVRNRPDGAVEAAFEGDEASVDAIVDWCRRGPRGARVEDVSVDDEQPRGETGFHIG